MERVLNIKGEGQIRIKPDTCMISLRLSHVVREYSDALRKSAVEVNEIKDLLEDLGLKRDELKTKSYNVKAEYESYRDKDSNYRSKFIGYRYDEELVFKFPINNELLSEILYNLGKSSVDAKISLSYIVLDEAKYKDECIRLAVENAKNKAILIADAVGITLGKPLRIDYNDRKSLGLDYDDYELSSPKLMSCCSDSRKIDIEPDDIEANDSVEIVYEII